MRSALLFMVHLLWVVQSSQDCSSEAMPWCLFATSFLGEAQHHDEERMALM